MSNVAISVEGLWKNFRLYQERNQYLKTALLRGGRTKHQEFWALKNVSFEITAGSTFGIIGSNGSGKSTLLKCLAGILTPDRGNLRVLGRLAALLELGAGFHPDLTGRENIYLNGAILGMTRRQIDRHLNEIVDFSGLEKFIDSPVKNYSSGMVVRLGFAVAINVDPEILLIDEVLAVGDEVFQQRCYEKIEAFRLDGRTIVFVSHGLPQVTQLCSTALWLENGSVREIGPAFAVVNRYSSQAHNAQPRSADETGDRWGSGEVIFSKVYFEDEAQSPTTVLESLRPAAIVFELEANKPIDEAVIGVRITQLHGLNVWGSNTKRRSFPVPTLSGSHRFKLNINQLPLLSGTYDLTVAVTDSSETRAYDHWEKKIRFDVNQLATYDEGLVHVESVWSMSKTDSG